MVSWGYEDERAMMTRMNPPLFDPEDDREHTEYDKWDTSYADADRHMNEKPGVEKGARIAILTCSILTAVVGLVLYWIL